MAAITTPRGDGLSIGALAKRTGVNLETIRYYERIGLVPAPPRTAGGHRVYGRDHLKRLAFIRRARGLGFTIEEVCSLLRLADRAHVDCAEVKAMTLAHLEDVRRRITDLGRIETALDELAGRCEGNVVPDCPVLEALSGTGPDARAADEGVQPSGR
jgi:MerR family transcriptional regulator, mercuric resistance operon regulatory protein